MQITIRTPNKHRQAANRAAGVIPTHNISHPDGFEESYAEAFEALRKRTEAAKRKRRRTAIASPQRKAIAKLMADGKERMVGDICTSLDLTAPDAWYTVIGDLRALKGYGLLKTVVCYGTTTRVWVKV